MVVVRAGIDQARTQRLDGRHVVGSVTAEKVMFDMQNRIEKAREDAGDALKRLEARRVELGEAQQKRVQAGPVEFEGKVEDARKDLRVEGVQTKSGLVAFAAD